MNSPQEPHFMTGTVEAIISQVQKDSSEEPGEGRVPGKDQDMMMQVYVVVSRDHSKPGE